ncbi:hypothetical protein KW797_02505, partial [Candidatus Parcubacteria bacterium]|nr:hypothetical protein [Candidatus Parcubacteria bacterium]
GVSCPPRGSPILSPSLPPKSNSASNQPSGGGVVSVSAFMVRSLERRIAANKNPFLYGEVFDATRTISACIWHASLVREDVTLRPGDVILGEWEFKEFNGAPQVDLKVLSDVVRAAAVTDFSPFVKVSHITRDEWVRFYSEEVLPLIEDPCIAELIRLAILEGKRFWTAPAAMRHHQAWRGGLAEHKYFLLKLFLSLLSSGHPALKACRKSLVIAGLVFHDWAKIFDYEETAPGQFGFTRYGSLVGHLAGGPVFLAMLVQKHDLQFSPDLWVHFQHVLLAHHGQLDWGSPVVPQTVEAWIVHLLDMLDGKTDELLSLPNGARIPGFGKGNVYHYSSKEP